MGLALVVDGEPVVDEVPAGDVDDEPAGDVDDEAAPGVLAAPPPQPALIKAAATRQGKKKARGLSLMPAGDHRREDRHHGGSGLE